MRGEGVGSSGPPLFLDASPITKLCLSLVYQLQQRPPLDDISRKFLANTRAEIDAALTSTTGSPPHPSPPVIPIVTSKAQHSLTSAFSSKVAAAPENSQDGSFSAQGRKTRKRILSTIKTRRQKVRVMTAVQPYAELTVPESNLTVLEKLLGKMFFAWWWRFKRIVGSGPLSFLLFCVDGLLFYAYTLFELSDTLRTAVVSTFAGIVCFLFLRQSAFWNFALLCKSLATFEAFFFLVELSLFSIALSGVFCFSYGGTMLAVSLTMAIFTTTLPYDSFPVVLRKGMRASLVLSCFFTGSYMALIYLRLPRQMCGYRFDLTRGEMEDEYNLPERSTLCGTRPRMSLSLVDVCINRGFTLLMLMLRATYLAFKHPQDCVLIRSRIRISELPVPDNYSGRKDPSKVEMLSLPSLAASSSSSSLRKVRTERARMRLESLSTQDLATGRSSDEEERNYTEQSTIRHMPKGTTGR